MITSKDSKKKCWNTSTETSRLTGYSNKPKPEEIQKDLIKYCSKGYSFKVAPKPCLLLWMHRKYQSDLRGKITKK